VPTRLLISTGGPWKDPSTADRQCAHSDRQGRAEPAQLTPRDRPIDRGGARTSLSGGGVEKHPPTTGEHTHTPVVPCLRAASGRWEKSLPLRDHACSLPKGTVRCLLRRKVSAMRRIPRMCCRVANAGRQMLHQFVRQEFPPPPPPSTPSLRPPCRGDPTLGVRPGHPFT